MNSREKALQYAAKYNDQKVYTDEQFFGKMIIEGVTISQFPRVIATAKRTGNEIIITETTVTESAMLVDGKVQVTETSEEVLRIEL